MLIKFVSVLSFIVSMSIAVSASSQVTATLGLDNGTPSVICANELMFKGIIKSDKPGTVQYRFIRSDGVLQPVETMEFNAPGVKETLLKWVLAESAGAGFKGWVLLQIIYPVEDETDSVDFSIICDPKRPDLAVKIRNLPTHARTGGDLKSALKVRAFNYGGMDIRDAVVDVTLRKEAKCPVAASKAARSAHFVDGMLLASGREKVSLKIGQKLDVKLTGPKNIPADTPPGDYFICASIDAGDKVQETSKGNNCSCVPIKITPAPVKPDLVIDQFTFKGWGKCEPGHPVLTFEVTVRNAGSVTSHAIPNKIMVQVVDLTDKAWANGSGLGAIPPGGTQTVVIPVYYYDKNPEHMTRVVPHPFRAIIDPLNLIEESSRKNNRSDIIYLDMGAVCGKGND
jgi:hypothetical protein